MLLVTVAIGALVMITGRVLLSQADASAQSELVHEGEKLRAFATQGDPVSGQPFTDVSTLLSSFMTHNLAERDETFFSLVGGKPDRRSASPAPARLDLDHAFVARAAATDRPIRGRVSTTAGDAYYAVFPVAVQGSPQQGALVAVEFLRDAHQQAWSFVRVLGLVGAGSLVLAGLAGWLIAGQVLAPIRTVRRTAEQIGESDLTRRISVSGTDDVALLAHTFNRMLDRLETAFATQRQFLDDAGHELRTPITIIRGHLELAGSDPAEQEQTRALVTAELDRMSRIVDDLMVLAKAERPDFLIKGPVDATDLVVETLTKVKTIAVRRWVLDEVAEATMTADGQRLTQALTQLVSNACRHTGDGDTIALGSRVEDGRLLLWVRDTGTGIPEERQEQIFQRFFRGDGERGGGAGLGLTIVQSIATAHGGLVRLASAPGRGSTFTLDLPFAPAPLPDNEPTVVLPGLPQERQ